MLRDRVALVAHGGYGRREVAPYSDVDLMILCEKGLIDRVAPLAERLLCDVFDTGLVLGHSVRTIDEACALACQDAQICTSLIESRLLAGSEPLYRRYLHRFRSRVRRRARRWSARSTSPGGRSGSSSARPSTCWSPISSAPGADCARST